MPTEVKVPALGESITSGILSSWNVADGDQVQAGQVLYELETDKVTQEGVAETSGVISLQVVEGAEVEIGAVIATIDESTAAEAPNEKASPEDGPLEEPSKEPEEPTEATTAHEPEATPALETEQAPQQEAPPGEPVESEEKTVPEEAPRLSPAVRKLVAETGVDPNAIQGTGKDGRILKADVLAAAKATPPAPESVSPAPEPEPDQAPARPPQPSPAAPTPQDGPRITRKPLSPIRRKIASRLVEAQQTAAILTTFNEADMSAVIDLRKKLQDSFVERHGVKLGFSSFFVKAVVHALKAVPELNVRIEGADLVQNHYHDVGVAVGTEKGLVVPVIRDCDRLSFAQIEQTVVDYAKAARSGKLKLEDMQGGCFTITNGGIYGSMLSTPILNPPQSGILGMHNIQERPVAVNGEVVIRPMMYLALSYDHRVVDGREAVTFLVKVKEAIEDPVRLALEV